MIDEFSFSVFVFTPLVAAILGSGAWLLQTRANRAVDATLARGETDKPVSSSEASITRVVAHTVGRVAVSERELRQMAMDVQHTAETDALQQAAEERVLRQHGDRQRGGEASSSYRQSTEQG